MSRVEAIKEMLADQSVEKKAPRECTVRVFNKLDFDKQVLGVALESQLKFRAEDPRFDSNFEYVPMIERSAFKELQEENERLKAQLPIYIKLDETTEAMQMARAAVENMKTFEKDKLFFQQLNHELKHELATAKAEIERLKSEARLHGTIVTQLQRGQKALVENLESQIQILRQGLEDALDRGVSAGTHAIITKAIADADKVVGK